MTGLPLIGSVIAPNDEVKVTVPVPGVPVALTATATMEIFVPSFFTDGAEAPKVSDAVGPLALPVDPPQAHTAAIATAMTMRNEARSEFTVPPTRATRAGAVVE